MPKMSSMDATYHATQDLIYALHNPSPESLLIKIGHGNKEELKTLADIFRKEKTPAIPPRVTVREIGKKKLQ